MSNSDMPAMPLTNEQIDAIERGGEYFGLTKREHFAAMAMQGILTNKMYEPPRRNKFKEMAEDAAAMADALLGELEK